MSALRIEFRDKNLHLPELGLWLDPHEPQTGKVFISHAHSDHIAEHREVILSAPTAKLMRARLEGKWEEHALNFLKPRRFENGVTAFNLTLLPAGHIFGSAMAHIQVDNSTLLYTGDFKLKQNLSAEPCQPRPADILIMETTYGRPRYVFPPAQPVIEGVIRFCREALDNDATPVLLGYSLGKSQELLCGLGDAGLPLMLHGAVYRLTKIYEQFGQCFPPYERYEAGAARKHVLLCPPHVVNSAMLRNLGKFRSAILTGWAVDPNCRFRYQCDAAFALSDHADFADLVEMVKRVQPEKVYTLHGFAAEFAHTLRGLGYDAQALSENEQFSLRLEGETGTRVKNRELERRIRSTNDKHGLDAANANSPAGPLFDDFARAASEISATTSKLEKIRVLAAYLQPLAGETLALATTWFSGRPFPPAQGKTLQLGWAVLRDALCEVGGLDEPALLQIFLKHSDLGETAFDIFQTRMVTPSVTIAAVACLFQKLHGARGPLAKAPLLSDVLEQCTALEAKYLVKIITGELRIGLKEGLVEEAVAAAFQKSADTVRQASLLLGDIGQAAQLTAADQLAEVSVVPFRPVKLMLASPEETAAAVWKRMSCSASAVLKRGENETEKTTSDTSTVWLEDKYDGIRCQIHKMGTRVSLYSRDLKEISNTFPELVDEARNGRANYILDGEIVAMRANEVLPFAELQKRLGRREGDLFMRGEVPIQFVAFDLLWLNGQSYLDCALRERRRTMESIQPLPPSFCLAQITQAASAEEINAAFDAARGRNNEGLMIKDPESCYTPGRRGLSWLKLKKPFATLDCVVVGAEYGHGKRNKVLSDYTFAVRDEATGDLKTIGKAYSGLTDVEISQLTQHFHKRAIRQRGRYFEVQPDTILEIAFDKIQRSDRHSSGLALRFPRIVRIRTDKTPEEIDTLENARRLSEMQGAR